MKKDVRHLLLCLCLLLFLGILTYHNSFRGVFLFDDISRIVDNENIRSLHGPWFYLGKTRRPLVYSTLSINYALGKLNTFGYHFFNLAVHLLAAFLLFGIVRRTCLLNKMPAGLQKDSLWLALVVSLVWLVHPLQTQSVTYIIQRAESMMGMFYLLTVYCSLRYFISFSFRWLAVAWVACFLGGITKEVMITAPVIVLLYDRVFISGTFREAFRSHRRLYLGLSVTVAAMLFLLFLTPPEYHPETGFTLERISSIERLFNEPPVIFHYLRLIVWPHPLVLDYDWPYVQDAVQVLPAGILMSVLVGLSVWSYVRYPRVGFLFLSFFIILFPTSTVIPLKLAFEHRLYLPLAPVIALLVLFFRYLLKKIPSLTNRKRLTVFLTILVVILLGGKTFLRNRDYDSAIRMWRDTIAKRPANSRAHYNLGLALYLEKKLDEAIRYFHNALRLKPDYAKAHYSLGVAYIDKQDMPDAIAHLQESLELQSPNDAEAHSNLGFILMQQNKLDEAIKHFEKALKIKPRYDQAENNLGVALMKQKKYQDALSHFRKALEINPDYANAYYNLGLFFYERGRPQKAEHYFRETIRFDPEHEKVYYMLGKTLFGEQKYDEAVESLKKFIAMNPKEAKAYTKLGLSFMKKDNAEQAKKYFKRALALNAQDAVAQNNWGVLLAKTGKYREAAFHFEAALKINPRSSRAYYNLGLSYHKLKRWDEAVENFTSALKFEPDNALIQYHLARALAQKGENARAVEHFKKALRLNPKLSGVREQMEILEKRIRTKKGD